jgi:hypothetical protein
MRNRAGQLALQWRQALYFSLEGAKVTWMEKTGA